MAGERAVRLGVLSLYRAVPGPLAAEKLADALVFADITPPDQAFIMLRQFSRDNNRPLTKLASDVVGGFWLTMGFHRSLTHRSFSAT